MGLICPDCQSNALDIFQSLDLPPDSCNDEISLQVVKCPKCGLHALALYEESRHGALDSESWHHEAYRVSEEDFQMVSEVIQRCPRPRDSNCRCSTHQMLGQTSGHRWDGLRMSGVKIQDTFNMQLGPS